MDLGADLVREHPIAAFALLRATPAALGLGGSGASGPFSPVKGVAVDVRVALACRAGSSECSRVMQWVMSTFVRV